MRTLFTYTDTTVREVKAGNGVTTVFNLAMEFFLDADLVINTVVAATGVTVLQVITTDYTLSGGSGASGTVTMVVAPPTGTNLVIERKQPGTQAIDYEPNSPIPAETIEEGLDRSAMLAGQAKEVADRALVFAIDEVLAPGDGELPVLALRKDRVLSFNSSTGKPEAVITTAAINEAAVDAAAAAVSAAAALVSETNAAADAVLTAADLVLTNADVVLTVADAVSTAADAVSTAADAANTATDATNTAADAVSTAADAVSTAADAASTATDATTATTQAAAAVVSAAAALVSENNAATSETNAATSAAEAAASAAGVNLPAIAAGDAGKIMRVNTAETAHEFRTPAQVRVDIGAEAVDVDIARVDVNRAWTAEQNFNDQVVGRPELKDYAETHNVIGATGGGTQDIDLTLGNVVSATVDVSANTFTFSNPPASAKGGSFTLVLTNGGSQTVTWPTSVDWPGGVVPTLTTAGVDVLVFVTIDGGTIWFGFVSGSDVK